MFDIDVNLSLVVRKPVFVVSDHVRHRPGCAVTEDGQRLEISLFCWLGSSCRLVHFHYVVVNVLGKIHHQRAGNLTCLLVTRQNDSLLPRLWLVEIRPSRVSFNSMTSHPRVHAGVRIGVKIVNISNDKYLIHIWIITSLKGIRLRPEVQYRFGFHSMILDTRIHARGLGWRSKTRTSPK